MKVFREAFELKSENLHPAFFNVTEHVKEIVAKSGVKDGICVIYSHHTTCSVLTQEDSHDKTYFGLEYLQQDLCNIMEKLVPTCRYEGQYVHPGKAHIEYAASVGDPPLACLNTDAHLRSLFFGRSETVVIMDGALDLGQFSMIYFVDWDQIRERNRQVQVQIIGE